MRVLLVRHGTAIPYDRISADEARWLTNEGRLDVRRVADALAARDIRPTHLFSSPFVRAVQTAEILLAELDPEARVEAVVELGLAADRGTIADAVAPLARLPDDAVAVLVSHMPKISSLASHLVGQRGFGAFVTGGVAAFDWEGGLGRAPGKLAFRLDPHHLAP